MDLARPAGSAVAAPLDDPRPEPDPVADATRPAAHPARDHAPRDRFVVVLAVIAAVGFLGRLAYTLALRNHTLWVDSLAYHFRAQDLADGNGYVLPARQIMSAVGANPPDAQAPPLWSLTLSVPTRLGMRSVLWQQLSVTLLGTATIVMTGLTGRAVFGRRVGLIAAAIVAIYPNVWLYERELLSEPLAMFEVAVMILLSYRFIARPSTWGAVGLGFMGGVLAMTRAEQILLMPLLVLPLVLGAKVRPFAQRVGWLALAGVACVAVISPWTAYNWNRFEQPVLLSNGFGQALRAGNCEPTYHGELLGYAHSDFFDTGKEDGCGILDQEFAADQSLVEDQLRDAAFQYMGDNRERVPLVAAARIGRTFNVYRPFQQVHFEAQRNTPLAVLRVALVAYWALAALAVVGVVVARRRGIPVYPILVYFVVVVSAVVLTIGAVRYRAPAEVPLALLAAVGIDHLLLRVRARRVGSGPAVAEPTGSVGSVL